MDELRPAKRNVEVEVEVKAVDRFRYDASKSKGYVRLTATVLTNREAVHRKASGPHLTVHASFLSGCFSLCPKSPDRYTSIPVSEAAS